MQYDVKDAKGAAEDVPAVVEPTTEPPAEPMEENKADVPAAAPPAAGCMTSHFGWRVPADDEAAVDAFWESHQTFMQAKMTMGFEGDDAVAPRLLRYYVTKGKVRR